MIRKQGQRIESLETWGRLAGPKSRVQWQDQRSAKESAKAWLGENGGTEMPKEVAGILEAHPAFSEVLHWEAEPECLVSFDEFSGPANIDVMAKLEDDAGAFVMAVEAKADEPFGPLLGRALTMALERKLTRATAKGIARIEQLAAAILPPVEGRVPRAHQMRYQLLTAAAAVLAKAHDVRAARAVLMIHEFRTGRTDERNLARNRLDLMRFLQRLGCSDPEPVFESEFVGPFTVPGNERIPEPADLYVGKAVRILRGLNEV